MFSLWHTQTIKYPHLIVRPFITHTTGQYDKTHVMCKGNSETHTPHLWFVVYCTYHNMILLFMWNQKQKYSAVPVFAILPELASALRPRVQVGGVHLYHIMCMMWVFSWTPNSPFLFCRLFLGKIRPVGLFCLDERFVSVVVFGITMMAVVMANKTQFDSTVHTIDISPSPSS